MVDSTPPWLVRTRHPVRLLGHVGLAPAVSDWQRIALAIVGSMRDSLTQVANRTDLAVATARAELEAVVRAAAAEGMTQQEIARAIGRSQPEVSRLLHFHGRSPLGRRLRKRAVDVRRLVAEAGGSNVRVFGSVAKGSDRQGSDIDLLFSMNHPLSLLELGTLERRIGDLVGAEVDLVPEAALRPDLRERALSEAVPL